MTTPRFYLVPLITLSMIFTLACKSKQTGAQSNQSGTDNANANVQPGGMSGGNVSNGRIFRGSVGNNKLQMTLNRQGAQLSGTYFYQKVGSDISLKGTINGQGEFTLQEFDNGGKQTGEFKGKWSEEVGLPSATLDGTWAKPGSNETLTFYATEQAVEFTSGLRVVTKEIKNENKKPNYTIDVEYPELSGASNPKAEKFNQEAKNLVAKEIKDFKDGVAEDSAEDASTESGTGSDIQIRYDVTYATDNLISVAFDVSTFSQGAAHPNGYALVINFDLKSGSKLKLADLFKPNSGYMNVISRYAISDLKKQSSDGVDDELLEKGAGPDPANYLNWNVSRKGLAITFDPYQVAGYAEGPKHVIVPYATLKEISKPDGPISSLSK